MTLLKNMYSSPGTKSTPKHSEVQQIAFRINLVYNTFSFNCKNMQVCVQKHYIQFALEHILLKHVISKIGTLFTGMLQCTFFFTRVKAVFLGILA